MFSCKELCLRLACFVIGGIITVMFSKILEWQRNQNPHEERGEGRIMVPIQEVGEEKDKRKELYRLYRSIQCK